MIDSGSQANFISPNLVNRLELRWNIKDKPYRLRNVEGESVQYGQGWVDMETAPLDFYLAGRTERIKLDITEISGVDVILGIPWLRASNPQVNWRTGHFQWDTPGSQSVEKERPLQAPFRDLGKRALTVYMIQKEPNERITEIPEEYSRYSKLFSEELETVLPKHTRWDHEITLKDGKEPELCKAYPLNPKHTEALKEFLDENLRKGFIRPSQSPAGYPILFVPKKNGKWRMCVDYRKLNQITIKNGYMLPLMAEIRDKTLGARYFTALDLKGAYNLIRIKEGNEYLTAFRTTRGHYEFLVMPFGLTNAPATFQTMINDVLRQYDMFVIVYLDDILIFSSTLEEHKKHVHKVLQTLQDNNLLVEPTKCEFHKSEVTFLGYVLSHNQIRMDPKKVASIQDWPKPNTIKEVQSFLGFVNFYRRFVEGYSRIALPLTDLTKKKEGQDKPIFKWEEKQQRAFEELKAAILTEPVLMIPDPAKPFELETDASGFALGAQLTQRDEQGHPHPVAFFSRKLHGSELNYGIPDQELMAIIEAFKEWRHYLSGTTQPVKVLTDHKNLTTFTTTKDLGGRQIRWSEFMSEFNFVITHVKGKDNGRADALSRRLDYKTKEETRSEAIFRFNDKGEMELNHQEDPEDRELNATWTVKPNDEWTAKFKKEYYDDDYIQGKERPWITEKDGLYYYNDRIYVPVKYTHELFKEYHEHPLHGHQGIAKTLSRIRRTYDFPIARDVAKDVIHNCDVCNKAKSAKHAPYGELRPIAPPDRAWGTIAMDFIVKLPLSKEPMTNVQYDSILVITDKLTKYAYFVPYKEASNAKELAYAFMKNITSQHGVPQQIITDRDKLFTSNFWKALMDKLGLKHKLSTAFHPQTDGQTERLNQTLEQYLRSYVSWKQDDWVELLPMAQWAYNSSDIESIKMSPFKANFGMDPKDNLGQIGISKVPAVEELAVEMKQLHEALQQEWIFLQNRMAYYANKKRLSAPILKRGDKVYLVRKNVTTNRQSDKLDWKKIGPYKIKKKLSDTNYKLELPKGTRIHPVFHVSLLEPAPKNIPVDRHVEVSPLKGSVIEYEVEKILKHQIEDGEKQYLIKWKNYDISESTWEIEEDLEGCIELLNAYKKKTLTKPQETRKEPAQTRQRNLRNSSLVPRHQE